MFEVNQRNFWRYWLGGIMLFSVLVLIGTQLSLAEAPGGIQNHQVAGSAARIDEIQNAWRSAGLLPAAKLAMALDLVFIGVYGLGALMGGLLFRRFEAVPMRRLGSLVAAASITFIVTDYGETICQFIQLMNFAGNDTLAATAATLQPIKMIAVLVTFVGILAGLFAQRWFKEE